STGVPANGGPTVASVARPFCPSNSTFTSPSPRGASSTTSTHLADLSWPRRSAISICSRCALLSRELAPSPPTDAFAGAPPLGGGSPPDGGVWDAGACPKSFSEPTGWGAPPQPIAKHAASTASASTLFGAHGPKADRA